jgi:hypothetical protein
MHKTAGFGEKEDFLRRVSRHRLLPGGQQDGDNSAQTNKTNEIFHVITFLARTLAIPRCESQEKSVKIQTAILTLHQPCENQEN